MRTHGFLGQNPLSRPNVRRGGLLTFRNARRAAGEGLALPSATYMPGRCTPTTSTTICRGHVSAQSISDLSRRGRPPIVQRTS